MTPNLAMNSALLPPAGAEESEEVGEVGDFPAEAPNLDPGVVGPLAAGLSNLDAIPPSFPMGLKPGDVGDFTEGFSNLEAMLAAKELLASTGLGLGVISGFGAILGLCSSGGAAIFD